jgi:hypothetical protein
LYIEYTKPLPKMKNILPLIAGFAISISLSAQTVQYNSNGSFYKQCLSVRTTKPLRELIAERDAKRQNTPKAFARVAADAAAHENHRGKTMVHDPNLHITDGSRQTKNGVLNASSTIVNIDGEPSVQGYYPLDPNGMIGSNYYVQTVNSYYSIYDKTGTKVLDADLYSIFGSIGDGDCGDPVTIYDKVADRWIITEFEGCESRRGNIDTLLFAVSKTNDPTGAYYLYAFDPASHNSDDDYPKYVVWADGYYMTCNCQGTDYVIAYDRAQMLTGSAAGYVAIPWTDSPYNFVCNTCAGPGFFCPMMLDCDGTLPPYGSPEYLFYYWDPNWGSGGNNEICIDKITVDWSNKTGTTSHYDTLPTTAFNSTFTGGTRADIAQPGNISTDYLDALDGFFSYRIPYLRWSSYNSAVMCNVVNVGDANNRIGGIRWYELHQDTTTGVWSIYQQSTYAPDDRVSRWNPSIAMDQNGSIGLEYSVSDSLSVYPGCRYTGRRSCDTLNTMTVAEVIARNGNALSATPQGAGNRWGDYSHLSVDPVDGITFWATNMYTSGGYSGGENIGTRIYSFQIKACPSSVPDMFNSDNATLNVFQNGSSLNLKGTGFPENERLVAEIFDVNGKMLMHQDIVSNTHTIETSFNVSTLSKAIYIVRIGNDRMQRVVKTTIN